MPFSAVSVEFYKAGCNKIIIIDIRHCPHAKKLLRCAFSAGDHEDKSWYDKIMWVTRGGIECSKGEADSTTVGARHGCCFVVF